MPIVSAGRISARTAARGIVPSRAGEALRGEPAEPHREDDDEHHPRPHDRHCREGLRPDAERRAGRTTAPHRRDHAERKTEHERDRQREDAERNRHLRLLGELLGDARAGEQRRAEVSAQDAADPLDVLRDERLVEPQLLADRRHLLGRAAGAGDQLRDVTGKDPQRQEDEHAGDEEPEQKQGQSRQRVSDHPSLLAKSARSMRAFTLIEGMPVMLVPTATTDAALKSQSAAASSETMRAASASRSAASSGSVAATRLRVQALHLGVVVGEVVRRVRPSSRSRAPRCAARSSGRSRGWCRRRVSHVGKSTESTSSVMPTSLRSETRIWAIVVE